jgi:uncharacterized protein YukE
VTRGGDRLDESALQAARAAVDYVRFELASVAAQMPDAADLEWRSAAQRRFQSRLDDLTDTVGQAMSALDHAAVELSQVEATPLGTSAMEGGAAW